MTLTDRAECSIFRGLAETCALLVLPAIGQPAAPLLNSAADYEAGERSTGWLVFLCRVSGRSWFGFWGFESPRVWWGWWP
jgi:hypothetical protein